ncbi:ABC transporter substrate-binding protein [Thermomonospora umbrina]|uniref:NitT/TauT family transport system substrate-binding protein n=1 Tax=Thermomonospora umbrina TaxID=111806 RepID=A0A3D9SUM0_9ACTN|nr:ABC transporter substrate-binding protein [Thermomonospora umbrina]REE97723.1 NitT/TauT family transport system substrate-binding protein [Thermomonospora umbrina]
MCAIVLVGSLTACGGSDDDGGGANGLEKSKLSVGTLPIPDAAPLFIAIQRGLFKKEGLTVTTKIVPNAVVAQPLLKSGQLDVTLNNYVGALIAEEQSGGAVRWRFIADSYQAEKGAFQVMVNTDSSIKTPKDLAGKKIAVPTRKAIGTLMVEASMRAAGVPSDSVEFVEMGFPQMPAALKAKRIDAAWVAEPFISQLQQGGARSVLDTADPGGPTKNIPVAGWAVLGDYAEKHPKTVAAFQRAIGQAQRMASGDRSIVTATLPTYVKGVNADTAKIITLGSFPTGQNPERLKRLAGLMGNYGYLKNPTALDFTKMIVQAPAQ